MIMRSILAVALLLSAVSPLTAAKPMPHPSAPKDACAAMRKHMTERPAAPVAGASRPLSQDSKDMLGKITSAMSAGEGGSASPDAQAQAALNMMAGMLASRSDAESQASAALLFQNGAKKAPNTAADMKALGC